jgi:hypothetical protein
LFTYIDLLHQTSPIYLIANNICPIANEPADFIIFCQKTPLRHKFLLNNLQLNLEKLLGEMAGGNFDRDRGRALAVGRMVVGC